MIKFEHDMLVLANIFSEEDVEEINTYTQYIRTKEQNRIIDIINNPMYHTLGRAHLIGVIQGASLDGEWD